MADYKIQIGAELRTKDIDTAINNYKGKIKIGVQLDTKGIDSEILSYKVGKKIEIDSKLNTKGITDTINKYQAKSPIKINAELDVKDINNSIANYQAKTPIKVNVELNKSSINQQIKEAQPREYIKINAKLDDSAISDAIRDYQAKSKIKVDLDLNYADINKKISDLEVRSPLRVKVKINKTDINQQLKEYKDTDQYITVKAKLDNGAVTEAIRNYKAKTPIKVDLQLNSENIDEILKRYNQGSPLNVDAKVNTTNIGTQIKNYFAKTPIRVGITLNDNELTKKIADYKTAIPITVGIKLDDKSLNSQIASYKTKKLIELGAVLDTEFLDKMISSYTAKTPIKVGVKLDGKNISEQIRAFKTDAPIEFVAKLDENSINQAIANYKQNAPIRLNVELNDEDINRQISAYKAKAPIQVSVKLDDSDINEELGKHKIATPIQVGVKLDREKINEQIRKFTTKTKIKLGIKLESKGIAEQIRKIEPKTKINVGIRLDQNDIAQQIGNVNTNTPVRLGVELDPNDVQNVQNQIDALRQQIQNLGNVNINLSGGNGIGGGNSGAATDNGGRGGRRQVDEVTQAYRELMGVLNELDSKRLQLNRLTASSPQSSNEIQRLRLQIEQLGNEYDNLLHSFNVQGIQFTADQWNQLESTMARVGRQIDVVQAKMADKSAVQSQTQAFKELISISKEIGSIETSIEKLRLQGGNSNQIEVLENQLRTLQSTYQQIVTTMNTPLTVDQWSSIYTQIAKTQDELEKLRSKHADIRAELAKKIKTDIGTGKLKKEINDVNESFKLLSIEDKNMEADITRLQTLLGNMDASSDIESVTSDYQDFLRLLQTVKNNVIELQRTQSNSGEMLDLKKQSAMIELNSLFEHGSQAAKHFGSRAKELAAELNACGNANVDNVTRKIANLGKEVKKSGLQTKTLGTRLKEQLSRYSNYLSIASVFMYATQAARNMFEQVKLIDSAMTELKKVTNETDESYNQFLSNAAKRSKELGTTIDGLVSSTADFARLGYGFEDSQKLAEVANIYAVVGDEIEGVEDATQSLVSTLAAFKQEANGMSDSDFAMSIVDKMNEVSNNFSISSGGIGEALQRSASSMAAANNSLDETIAMITAANEVAQNPEKVGNAFKTMSMRIRGAKTELEEAGESTDGMAESTASLRAEMLALSGVDIMLNDTTFKSTYQIMDELSNKWKDLSDIAQATIIELVAGKHQGNVFSSLMANFDTARKALDTSLNSSGSAMAEHAKWSESLEARLNKLKAAWQSLSQTFMNSKFLKVGIDLITGFIEVLDKIIDKVGVLPLLFSVLAGKNVIKKIFNTSQTMQFAGGISRVGDVISILINSFPKLTKAVTLFMGELSASGSMLSAFGAAAGAFNPVILGITAVIAAVGIGIAAYNKYTESAEELAERIEDVTSKYEEQHDSLIKLKGDYDTSKEDSMISKYEKLSKGVNSLGENVSLTADEYSEYQGIVDTIANQIPSLVTGYNSQGDAILECAGDVDKLTEAYQNLIKTQNNEVLKNGEDIFKDFSNDLKKSSGYGVDNNANYLEELNNLLSLSDEELEAALRGNPHLSSLSKVLSEYGIERDVLGSGKSGYEGFYEHVVRAIKEERTKVKDVLDEASNDLNAYAEELGTVTEAYFSTAFLGGDKGSNIGDYSHLSERMQNIINQVTSGFSSDFYTQFLDKENPYEALTEYFDSMLKAFDGLGSGDSANFEAAFDLKTKFNGGDISYGEYVDGLKDAGSLIDRLDLDDEVKTQIKLSLGLNEDGLVDEYEDLSNRLVKIATKDLRDLGHFSGAKDAMKKATEEATEGAKEFLDSLSAEELSVATDIIPEFDAGATFEEIKAAIDREMAVRGLTFDLNLEVESAGIEALNTALAESVSATGLSSESIAALKGRYADIESQGYDLSSMFEETSHGIRLNRQEFNKLENIYSTQKLADIDSDLMEMKIAYDDLGEAIKNCDDPIKKSELFNDRQTLANKISEAATLAHQYKGLTSAYNDWLAAEEAGQERDMYEKVIEGFENIDDEIKRGWLDDGTIEFLELLTGKDLSTSSIDKIKEAYDGLDNKIKDTTYSIRDFFTVDEDGNSTNAGVYNFLDAIGQLEEEEFGGKDVVKRDKDGNIIAFDFEVAGGDEAIADALGISEELVQIMVRAADDAGFVVSMDGAYRQLADLQNEAKAAADYLHQIGKTDFEFDFNTSSVENLKTQLEEAHKILDSKEFWNKDGTFNFNADGATQAMQVVSTLQAKLDKLTEEKYGIGLTVEDEEFEKPLENLQEYGRNIATLNQLKLNPKANAEEIEEINGELNEIAEYFANLDGDLKVKLGFESDDGIEEVKKKIESGEVKIPTILDIQANMDKNIETLADLALLNSGLLSESEEEIIRKKYKVEVEADEVDTSDVDEKVDNAIIDGLGNPILSREANIEIIAETFGVEDVDSLSSKLEGLDDKTIQAIAEAIGQGDVDALQIAIEGMDGNTVQAVAEALGYSDVETLKAAIRNMQGNEVDAKVNTDGQKEKVDTFQSWIDNLKGKTVDIVINTFKNVFETVSSGGKKKAAQRTGSNPDGKGSGANGTANVNGTTGRAFKQGSWGTKNSGTALVGELGTETLVRDGKYYTIGDTGAEFIKYRKGDIIFNHRQTEELFANGKVTSGGGRAKAFVGGTAFSKGSGGLGRVSGGRRGKTITETATKTKKEKDSTTTTTTTTTTATTSSSGSSGSGGGVGKVEGNSVGSNSNAEKFEETFDAVEIKISRIERAIDSFDKKANNVYASWSSRNKALTDEIGEIRNEISLQESAYDSYMAEANSVGLDEAWAKRVRNGTIGIYDENDFNEATANKIKDYQTWYEKALACKDAIEDLKITESELYQQRFDNIVTKYEGILEDIEHEKSLIEESISQYENTALSDYSVINEKDYQQIAKYYQELIAQEQKNIVKLEAEKRELMAEFNSGHIKKGTEAWNEMQAKIHDVDLAIQQANTSITEFNNNISQTHKDSFDNIATQFDNALSTIEHRKNMIEEYIAQSEAQGHLISENYYKALIDNEKNNNLAELINKRESLIASLQAGMASKDNPIVEGSQVWHDMVAEIDAVTLAIEQSNTQLLEYEQTLQQLSWEKFDLLQERISAVTEEANFFIELMSNKKLYDDDGQLTSEGKATMGLHGQNYNTYMYQADEYGAEAARLKAELANDPFDVDLEKRYREMISLQQEHILAAEGEKNAIRDMVEEGINLELDALQERIDLYNEALESQKDLDDYQRRVKEQAKEISSLTKQMTAYEGDESEEGKAKWQELKVSLEDAKADLEETEYDKRISDQQKMLDELYINYETTLNTRLDNVDGLISDMIVEINNNSGMIATTLFSSAEQVGYTMSDSMRSIWEEAYQNEQLNSQQRVEQVTALVNQLVANGTLSQQDANRIIETLGAGDQQSIKNTTDLINQLIANGTLSQQDAGKIINALNASATTSNLNNKDIVAEYTKNFNQKSTTTNAALSNIKNGIDAMISQLNIIANAKVKAEQTSSVANSNNSKKPTTSTTPSTTAKPATPAKSDTSAKRAITDDVIAGIAAAIWIYGKNSGWGNNPFRENKLTEKIGAANAKKVQQYINAHSANKDLYNLWVKRGKNLDEYKYNAFKLGAKDIYENQLAWTQEGNKREFIVRPSDGAILTPIAKGDSVLNANASNNIWNMANSPADFIKDNLNFGVSNVPNNSSVQSNLTQHFENIVFSMPNVKNYGELLSELQKDPKFDKLIKAMTIDQIAGKSSLAKGKAIR